MSNEENCVSGGFVRKSTQHSTCYNSVCLVKVLFCGSLIMCVYIAPEPGHPVLRRCTVLLSQTQTCFHPTHISTPKGAYNAL